jgi:hypothetical protein
MANIITEKKPQADLEDTRNEVKILTIENQKLVSIIEKMRKSKTTETTSSKLLECQSTIKELNKVIK